MKRQILTLGAICAAAFTLTNCNKEIAEPKAPVAEGTPFEIVAATADTKTANDGLNTVWAPGDALNVFHAEAGTTAYGTNDEFTYAGADNKFTGTLKTALGGGKSYDWYALYPYNNQITNPTGTDRKYTLIGKKNGTDTGDTQDGNDSKAHLSGRSCPMYAVAKNVAASSVPTFTMKHLTSVVAVTVTNTNDAPLTVNSVSFSAPEGTTIFGSFYINFTENGGTVYKNHTTASWTSNTSNLTVKNGTAIKKNEKATFYLAIKPFAAKTGDELKISVNGYEKTHKLAKDVEFKAGKIETVNFKYNNTSTSHQVVYSYSNFSGGKSGSAGTAMTVTNSDSNIELTATGYHKSSATHVKLYANDSFTVTAKNGVSIKKIEISANSGYPGNWEITSGAGTITSNVWEGTESSSVTLKNKDSKQAQITKITVTYE